MIEIECNGMYSLDMSNLWVCRGSKGQLKGEGPTEGQEFNIKIRLDGRSDSFCCDICMQSSLKAPHIDIFFLTLHVLPL